MEPRFLVCVTSQGNHDFTQNQFPEIVKFCVYSDGTTHSGRWGPIIERFAKIAICCLFTAFIQFAWFYGKFPIGSMRGEYAPTAGFKTDSLRPGNAGGKLLVFGQKKCHGSHPLKHTRFYRNLEQKNDFCKPCFGRDIAYSDPKKTQQMFWYRYFGTILLFRLWKCNLRLLLKNCNRQTICFGVAFRYKARWQPIEAFQRPDSPSMAAASHGRGSR